MNKEYAGTVTTDSGTYRPVVFTAHSGVYFYHVAFEKMDEAVGYAHRCILDTSYKNWHFHQLT